MVKVRGVLHIGFKSLKLSEGSDLGQSVASRTNVGVQTMAWL